MTDGEGQKELPVDLQRRPIEATAVVVKDEPIGSATLVPSSQALGERTRRHKLEAPRREYPTPPHPDAVNEAAGLEIPKK